MPVNLPIESQGDALRALAQAGESFIKSFIGDLPRSGLDGATLHRALASSPEGREKLAALQARYYRDWLELWAAPDAAAAVNDPSDRRFDAPEWNELPWFRLVRRLYALNSEYLAELAELAELAPDTKRRLRFLVRQFIDATAPTNNAATNPEAIKAALASGGQSFARGLGRLTADLARGRISMTDEAAFEVGRNLAVTPGDVVYQNEIVQLIQYRPATTEVYERPLLIVPPFINKYYILDLQPSNSFARFCVEQGFTTFVVSWRNIPQELGRLTWDDYIEKGVFRPLRAVREISSSLTLNALGFCVGGTLLACALAVLAARGRRPAGSLTLLASMLDFSDTGDIRVYVDREYVERCERDYREGGIVSGSRLAAAFATLRANDLVWFFVINNYLLGNDPKPFDLLYWNADGSNLPGPLYSYYLRNMYLENSLRVPGKLRMQGTAVDLGKLRIPAYVLATKEDHIVPWRTAYRSAHLLGGRTEFVLGASGHVAGIVNPANQQRRHHWTNPVLLPNPDEWLAAAQRQPGSWWPHWSRWLVSHSGERRPAPATSGDQRHEPIEPSPGSYVRERSE